MGWKSLRDVEKATIDLTGGPAPPPHEVRLARSEAAPVLRELQELSYKKELVRLRALRARLGDSAERFLTA